MLHKTSLSLGLVLAALGASSTITDKRSAPLVFRLKYERGRIIPPRMVNSTPNSRVRMSKKDRIILRDRNRERKGTIYHTLHSLKRIRRAVAA